MSILFLDQNFIVRFRELTEPPLFIIFMTEESINNEVYKKSGKKDLLSIETEISRITPEIDLQAYKKLYRYGIKKPETPLSCICINCENYIIMENIEQHSEYCIKPQNAVLDIDCCNEAEESLFKLKKLYEKTKELLNSLHAKNKQYYIFSEIKLLLREAINAKNEKHLRSIIKNFEKFKNQEFTEIGMVLYLERMSLLLNVFLTNFSRLPRETEKTLDEKIRENEIKIKIKEEKIQRIRKKAISSQSKDFTHVDGSLSERRMECELDKEKCINPFFRSFDRSFILKDPDSRAESENQLARHFYDLFILHKYRIRNKRSIKISFMKLYQHAVEKNIPFEDWEDFIIESINKPIPSFSLNDRRSETINPKRDYFKIITEDS